MSGSKVKLQQVNKRIESDEMKAKLPLTGSLHARRLNIQRVHGVQKGLTLQYLIYFGKLEFEYSRLFLEVYE